MKAFWVTQHDSAPRLSDVPEPSPGPGEILLNVRACALNFADRLMLTGTYQDTPALPFAPGMEMAGTVAALGAGVTAFDIGDAVAGFAGNGGLAERAVINADRCLPMPPSMDFETAAAFQVAYGTSHLALAHRANLKPGETLVVTGAAGGVGLTAVELGVAMGARVIAIARTPEKLEIAKAAGAHIGIEAGSDDIRGQLKALGGIDVAYDAVGGDLFDAVFRAANPEARLLLIGFAGGDLPKLRPNHMLVKNITVMGIYWGGYLGFAPQVLTKSLTTLTQWHAQGRLHPLISARFPLDQADKAFAAFSQPQSSGKVVVTVPGG